MRICKPLTCQSLIIESLMNKIKEIAIVCQSNIKNIFFAAGATLWCFNLFAEIPNAIVPLVSKQTPDVRNKMVTLSTGSAGNQNFVSSTEVKVLEVQGVFGNFGKDVTTTRCEKDEKFLSCSSTYNSDAPTYSFRVASCLTTISPRYDTIFEHWDYPKIGAPEIKFKYTVYSGGNVVSYYDNYKLVKTIGASEIGWDIPGPVLVYDRENGSKYGSINSQTYYSTYLNCVLPAFPKISSESKFRDTTTVTIEYRLPNGTITKAVQTVVRSN